MAVALFLIGEPGVGKTTAIRRMFQLPSAGEMNETEVTLIPKPKWTLVRNVALAGHYVGETFDGADTVPYTGAREALEYWNANLRSKVDLTVFDGDRFSTQPSLDYVRATGVRVVGVYLTVPPEISAARRAQRGSNQNPTWLKGRVTKARNFAEKLGAVTIIADESPVFVAERIGLRLAEAA